MRTIEEIEGRCRIEDGDDGKTHWIWAGAMRSRRGHRQLVPAVWAPDFSRDPEGVMRAQSVGRAIVHITTGKAIPKGKAPYRICDHDACVNPACFTKPMTPTEWGGYVKKHKILQRRCNYTELNLKSWATRGRKFSDDFVKEVLASELTAQQLEKLHGIDEHYVHTIRRGEARLHARRAAAGVFAGLLR